MSPVGKATLGELNVSKRSCWLIAVTSVLISACGGGDSSGSTDRKSAMALTTGTTTSVPGTWTARVPSYKIDTTTGLIGGVDYNITGSATATTDFVAPPTPTIDFRGVPVQSDRIHVGVVAGTTYETVAGFVTRLGWSIAGHAVGSRLYTLSLNTKHTIADALAVAKSQAGVDFVSPAYARNVGSFNAITNDPAYGTTDAADAGLLDIGLDRAWNLLRSNTVTIEIGVFDAGFRLDSPDLTNLISIDYTAALPGFALQETTLRDCFPANADPVSDSFCSDHNHGMHVAGIIGATPNNSAGVAGVSGYNTRLHGYKVYKEEFRSFDIGFRKLAGRRVRVVNMSMGHSFCTESPTGDQIVQRNGLRYDCRDVSQLKSGGEIYNTIAQSTRIALDAVTRNPNILYVQAAGNDAELHLSGSQTPIDSAIGGYFSAAASKSIAAIHGFSNEEINRVRSRTLIVGSYSIVNDKLKSNFSAAPPAAEDEEYPFILAPGRGIPSLQWMSSAQVIKKDGTSQAAPHVTGVAGLVYRALPEATPEDVRNIILSTASNRGGTPWKPGDGFKYLNAEAAVRKARERHECGTISSPRAIGIGSPVVVEVGQLVSLAVTPNEKAGYPYVSYTWESSAQGAEPLTWAYPRADIRPSTPGTVRVRVTPSVDGVTCVDAAQELTITVVSPAPVVPLYSAPNGSTYEIADCGNWFACRQYAASKGGQLAAIRSQAENDWIVANLLPKATTEYGFWIGFNDRLLDGFWTWDSGDPVSYVNWGPWYNPNPNIEDAAHLAKTWGGAWNDTYAVDSTGIIRQGLIEYLPGRVGDRVYINVQNFKSTSQNIAADSTIACRTGLVYNGPPYTDRANVGEWDVMIPADGLYRVSIHYSAEQSRPVQASIDGNVLTTSALSGVNGTWCSTPLMVEPIGDSRLTRGTHTLRLDRSSVFPHLARIVFTRVE